ncbi:MAG: efflux RND transporter permease subunit [Deltaproteobacteria bacterium]|nr:efflux RND transporter permease subunit [Deltaproteobacteria bacterium]
MIGGIIEWSAKNRFFVVLAAMGLAAGAYYAMREVPLDAIPDLSDTQVIVFTEWMGRSPTLVEDQITYPLVTSLVSAPKVTDVRGFSMFGMSFLYVLFEEGTDVYWARSRVLEYLGSVRERLPDGVSPTLGPDATGVGWAFQYTLVDKSGNHDLAELRTFQDFTLRYAVAAVPGVAEVASLGGYEKQYQVIVEPRRLRAYGIPLDEVIRAVRGSSNDVGGRVVEMSGREYYVRGRGYIENLGDLAGTVVRASGPSGTPIRLSDLGEVRFGPDMRRGLLEWNGTGEAVGAIVIVRDKENALEVIDRVKEKLRSVLPSDGIDFEVAYDRSALIRRSIDTLTHSLLEEAIVVSVVIILFLLHFRSALVPILSLPIGVAAAFIPMAVIGVSSNIMSLGGIAIAIGAMVDAAIVMVENAHKKLEKHPPGAPTLPVMIDAAREVGPAIFFSLLVITVGFLPIFALTGQPGRLFIPMAFTKTFVMFSSAILAITLGPALMAIFIRGKIRHEADHPISKVILRAYKPFVYVALRNPITTISIAAFAILSMLPLVRHLGSEFMPPLNEGDILYMPTTFPNISIEQAKVELQRQDRVLASFPEVLSVFGKIGRAETATDPAPLTMVETTIRLRPREEWRKVDEERWYSGWAPGWLKAVLRSVWADRRPLTWEELTAKMNVALQPPGWTNAFTMPIKTRIDMLTTGVRTPIGIKVFGDDLQTIEHVGTALEAVISPIRGTRSVLYERNLGGLYIDIIPDRAALARQGMTVDDLQRTIEAAIGGMPILVTVEGRSRFSINVRYPQDVRSDIDALRALPVPVGRSGGGMGPMGAVSGPRQTLIAQNMPMGGGPAGSIPAPPGLGSPMGQMVGPMSDVPTRAPMGGALSGAAMSGGSARGAGGASGSAPSATRYLPLGQLAEVKIVSGPPMVRDEDGLLVGYVYVDIDTNQRDIGGYVDEAKAAVERARQEGRLHLTSGMFLKWTGQYELLEKMTERMKVVLPLTLGIIIILLFLHFRNMVEVLIVLCSIPFALVGSVWAMYLLDYRISTAVWVGVIALGGLAAQTGIVMIVYIDHAFERRQKAGKIRCLQDIVWAHMEGTVMRVRPKLMTVATMMVGLLPLLWAEGSGADVMKRIAAPMVGGLATSAFLTLEVIPVIYTYWRWEQLLWGKLAETQPRLLARLRPPAILVGIGFFLPWAIGLAMLYLTIPFWIVEAVVAVAGAALLGGAIAYLIQRPGAARAVALT